MKTSHITRLTVLASLAILFMFATTSCSKRKIEKSIEGVWNLEGISGQNMPKDYTMTGTFIFGDCKGNKPGDMSYNMTFSYQGASDNTQFSGPYEVLAKGERMNLLDAEWDISIVGNTMTLTLDDPTNRFSYNFTR
jgi:hypothetical protein